MATRRHPFDAMVDFQDSGIAGLAGGYLDDQARRNSGISGGTETTVQPAETPQMDWSQQNFAGNPDLVRQYYQSRGVTPNATTPDYWSGKWNELVQRGQQLGQSDYAYRRLQAADEFLPNQDPRQSPFYYGGAQPGGGSEFNDPWGAKLEQLVGQFLGNSQQRGQELANTYRTRAGELRQPAFSDQEDAALQAKAFDQLERRRQETLKNRRESVYLRGFAPTSGIVQGEEKNVNNAFEQHRTGVSSDLLRAKLDETESRRNAATQLESLATQALNGGDLGAIQATGLPLQLMSSRQNQAQQVLNSSNQSSQLLSLLLSSAMGQQGNRQQNNANNMSGLGWILQNVLGMF